MSDVLSPHMSIYLYYRLSWTLSWVSKKENSAWFFIYYHICNLSSALRAFASFPIWSSNAAWLEWLINLQLHAGIVNTTGNPHLHATREWFNLGGIIQPRKDPPFTPQLYTGIVSFWTNIVWSTGLLTRVQTDLGVFHLLHGTIEYRWSSVMTMHCSLLQAIKRYIMKSMFWRKVR